MFEGIVKNLIVKYLSEYLECTTEETDFLSLAVWSGDVNLSKLFLKRTALDGLGLPLEVDYGFVEDLTIKIPWNQLRSQSCEVKLTDLLVICKPKKNCVWDEEREKERQHRMKMNRLKIYETIRLTKENQKLEEAKKDGTKQPDPDPSVPSQTTDPEVKGEGEGNEQGKSDTVVRSGNTDSSWTNRMFEVIINNLIIDISNVHFRYEDNENGIAFGLIIERIQLHSCNKDWVKQFVGYEQIVQSLYKKGSLEGLSLYICSEGEEFFSTINPWNSPSSNLKKTQEEKRVKMLSYIRKSYKENPNIYFLDPIKGFAKLEIQRAGYVDYQNAKIPKMQLQLELPNVSFRLDDNQFRSIMKSFDYMYNYRKYDRFRKFKPRFSSSDLTRSETRAESSKSWWKYLLQSSEEELTTKFYTFDQITSRRREKDKYIKLFKRTLELPWIEKLGRKELEEFNDLEEILSFDDIVFFRTFAHKEVELESKKHSEIQLQKSWISSWFGPKDVIELTEEEKGDLVKKVKETFISSSDEKDTSDENVKPTFIHKKIIFRMKKASFVLYDSKMRDENAKKKELEKREVKKEARILSMKLRGANVKFLQRQVRFDIGVSLQDFEAADWFSTDTLFRKIICRRGRLFEGRERMLEEEEEGESGGVVKESEKNKMIDERQNRPLVRVAGIFYPPPHQMDGRDIDLGLRMEHLDIVINFTLIQRVLAFFTVYSSVNLNKIKIVSDRQKINLQKMTQTQLQQALDLKKVIGVNINIDAPRLLFPQTHYSSDTPILMINLGHLKVKSIINPKKKAASVTPPNELEPLTNPMIESMVIDNKSMFEKKLKRSGSVVDEEFKRFYDTYELTLDNFEVFFTKHRSLVDIKGDTPIVPLLEDVLVDKVGLTFTMKKSITRVLTLPYIVCSGDIREIKIKFSPKKLEKILRMVNRVMRFIDDPTGSRERVKRIQGNLNMKVLLKKNLVSEMTEKSPEKSSKNVDSKKSGEGSGITTTAVEQFSVFSPKKSFFCGLLGDGQLGFYDQDDKRPKSVAYLHDAKIRYIEREEKSESEVQIEVQEETGDTKIICLSGEDIEKWYSCIDDVATKLTIESEKELVLPGVGEEDQESSLTTSGEESAGGTDTITEEEEEGENEVEEEPEDIDEFMIVDEQKRMEKRSQLLVVSFHLDSLVVELSYEFRGKDRKVTKAEFRHLHLQHKSTIVDHQIAMNLKSFTLFDLVQPKRNEYILSPVNRKSETEEEGEEEEKDVLVVKFYGLFKESELYDEIGGVGSYRLLVDFQEYHMFYDPKTVSHLMAVIYDIQAAVNELDHKIELYQSSISLMKTLPTSPSSSNLTDEDLRLKKSRKKSVKVEKKIKNKRNIIFYLEAKMKKMTLKLMEYSAVFVFASMNKARFEMKTAPQYFKFQGTVGGFNLEDCSGDGIHKKMITSKDTNKSLVDFSYKLLGMNDQQASIPKYNKFVDVTFGSVEVIYLQSFLRRLKNYFSNGSLWEIIEEKSSDFAANITEAVKEQVDSMNMVHFSVVFNKVSVFCPCSHLSKNGFFGTMESFSIRNEIANMNWKLPLKYHQKIRSLNKDNPSSVLFAKKFDQLLKDKSKRDVVELICDEFEGIKETRTPVKKQSGSSGTNVSPASNEKKVMEEKTSEKNEKTSLRRKRVKSEKIATPHQVGGTFKIVRKKVRKRIPRFYKTKFKYSEKYTFQFEKLNLKSIYFRESTANPNTFQGEKFNILDGLNISVILRRNLLGNELFSSSNFQNQFSKLTISFSDAKAVLSHQQYKILFQIIDNNIFDPEGYKTGLYTYSKRKEEELKILHERKKRERRLSELGEAQSVPPSSPSANSSGVVEETQYYGGFRMKLEIPQIELTLITDAKKFAMLELDEFLFVKERRYSNENTNNIYLRSIQGYQIEYSPTSQMGSTSEKLIYKNFVKSSRKPAPASSHTHSHQSDKRIVPSSRNTRFTSTSSPGKSRKKSKNNILKFFWKTTPHKMELKLDLDSPRIVLTSQLIFQIMDFFRERYDDHHFPPSQDFSALSRIKKGIQRGFEDKDEKQRRKRSKKKKLSQMIVRERGRVSFFHDTFFERPRVFEEDSWMYFSESNDITIDGEGHSVTFLKKRENQEIEEEMEKKEKVVFIELAKEVKRIRFKNILFLVPTQEDVDKFLMGDYFKYHSDDAQQLVSIAQVDGCLVVPYVDPKLRWNVESQNLSFPIMKKVEEEIEEDGDPPKKSGSLKSKEKDEEDLEGEAKKSTSTTPHLEYSVLVRFMNPQLVLPSQSANSKQFKVCLSSRIQYEKKKEVEKGECFLYEFGITGEVFDQRKNEFKKEIILQPINLYVHYFRDLMDVIPLKRNLRIQLKSDLNTKIVYQDVKKIYKTVISIMDDVGKRLLKKTKSAVARYDEEEYDEDDVDGDESLKSLKDRKAAEKVQKVLDDVEEIEGEGEDGIDEFSDGSEEEDLFQDAIDDTSDEHDEDEDDEDEEEEEEGELENKSLRKAITPTKQGSGKSLGDGSGGELAEIGSDSGYQIIGYEKKSGSDTKTPKSPKKKEFAKEELQILVETVDNSISLLAVDDVRGFDVPLIKFFLDTVNSKTDLKLTSESTTLVTCLHFRVEVSYYNLRLADWEPLIEEWFGFIEYRNIPRMKDEKRREYKKIEAKKGGPKMKLRLSKKRKERFQTVLIQNDRNHRNKTKTLNITVTHRMLRTIKTTKKLWKDDFTLDTEDTVSMKFDAYTVRNHSGTKVTFWKHSEPMKKYFLEPGQDVGLDFEKGIMRGEWKRQLDVVFLLNNFRPQKVNVKKIGSFLATNSKAKCVLYITVELKEGRKMITIRSGVLIRNDTNVPWEIGVSVNQRTVNIVGTVAPGGDLGIPLKLVDNGILTVRPENGKFHWCRLIYPHHTFEQFMRIPKPRVLMCKRINITEETKSMGMHVLAHVELRNKVGADVLQRIPSWQLQQFNVTIRLRSPLAIENLLGLPIQVKLFELRQRKDSPQPILKDVCDRTLKRGEKLYIYDVNMCRNIRMSLGFVSNGAKFKSSSNVLIYHAPSKTLEVLPDRKMVLTDPKSNELVVLLSYLLTNGSAYHEVSLYCKYWLVNHTGLDLKYWYQTTGPDPTNRGRKRKKLQVFPGQHLDFDYSSRDIHVHKVLRDLNDMVIESCYYSKSFLTVEKIREDAPVTLGSLRKDNEKVHRFVYMVGRLHLLADNSYCLEPNEDGLLVIRRYKNDNHKQFWTYKADRRILENTITNTAIECSRKKVMTTARMMKKSCQVRLVPGDRYYHSITEKFFPDDFEDTSSDEDMEEESSELDDEDNNKKKKVMLKKKTSRLQQIAESSEEEALMNMFQKRSKKVFHFDPLMFSFPLEMKKEDCKMCFHVHQSDITTAFSTEDVGVPGHLEVVSDGRCYDIGKYVSLAPGKYGRTKVVTFTSRFRFVNITSHPVYVRQALEEEELKIPANQKRNFYWSKVKQRKLIQIRGSDASFYSTPIDLLGGLGEQYVKLRLGKKKTRIIKVSLKMSGGTIFAVISKVPENKVPYIVYNKLFNNQTIMISQSGAGVWWEISSRKKIKFCWDDNQKPGKVDIKLGNKTILKNHSFQRVGSKRIRISRPGGKKHLQVSVHLKGPTRILIIKEIKKKRRSRFSRAFFATPGGAVTPGKDTEGGEDVSKDLNTNNGGGGDDVKVENEDSSSSALEMRKKRIKMKEQNLFRATVFLDEVGISLVNDTPVEVLYFSIERIHVSFERTTHNHYVNGDVYRFQVDDQRQEKVLLPVVVSHAHFPPDQPVLKLSIVQERKTQIINYFSVLLQELSVQLDVSLLIMAYEFFRPFTSYSIEDKEIEEEDTESVIRRISEPEIHPQDEKVIYFDLFELHPVKINFTFRYSKQDVSLTVKSPIIVFLDTLGFTLVNCECVPLRLNALILKHPFCTLSSFLDSVKKHYVNQVTRELYKIVGGLDIIGNPVGLFNDISTGVEDLFYEPFKAQTMDPREFSKAVMRGGYSLITKTLHGTFNAAAKVTGTLGKGATLLTFDDEYIKGQERGKAKRPDNALEGISSGASHFGRSVMDGLGGFVRKPFEGYMNDGLGGFLKGVGKGVMGVPMKPVVGLLGFASTTADGVSRGSRRDEYYRHRLIRVFREDGCVVPYDREISLYQYVLMNIQPSSSISSEIVNEIYQEKAKAMVEYGERRILVLLTNRSILQLRAQGNVIYINWRIKLDEIKRFERIRKKGIFIFYSKKKKQDRRSVLQRLPVFGEAAEKEKLGKEVIPYNEKIDKSWRKFYQKFKDQFGNNRKRIVRKK